MFQEEGDKIAVILALLRTNYQRELNSSTVHVKVALTRTTISPAVKQG